MLPNARAVVERGEVVRYEIDAEALARNAEAHAAGVAAAWARKLAVAAARLGGSRVLKLGGAVYRIGGVKGGRGVVVEQGVIVTMSRTGAPVAQHPTRA